MAATRRVCSLPPSERAGWVAAETFPSGRPEEQDNRSGGRAGPAAMHRPRWGSHRCTLKGSGRWRALRTLVGDGPPLKVPRGAAHRGSGSVSRTPSWSEGTTEYAVKSREEIKKNCSLRYTGKGRLTAGFYFNS